MPQLFCTDGAPSVHMAQLQAMKQLTFKIRNMPKHIKWP